MFSTNIQLLTHQGKGLMHEYFLCTSVYSVGTCIMKNTFYFSLALEMSDTQIHLMLEWGTSTHPSYILCTWSPTSHMALVQFYRLH